MPSINVRFTDEQHAALTAAAARSGRSVQKQIIYILFTDQNWGAQAGAPVPGNPSRVRQRPLIPPLAAAAQPGKRSYEPDPK